jgi:hypothetical protein
MQRLWLIAYVHPYCCASIVRIYETSLLCLCHERSHAEDNRKSWQTVNLRLSWSQSEWDHRIYFSLRIVQVPRTECHESFQLFQEIKVRWVAWILSSHNEKSSSLGMFVCKMRNLLSRATHCSIADRTRVIFITNLLLQQWRCLGCRLYLITDVHVSMSFSFVCLTIDVILSSSSSFFIYKLLPMPIWISFLQSSNVGSGGSRKTFLSRIHRCLWNSSFILIYSVFLVEWCDQLCTLVFWRLKMY